MSSTFPTACGNNAGRKFFRHGAAVHRWLRGNFHLTITGRKKDTREPACRCDSYTVTGPDRFLRGGRRLLVILFQDDTYPERCAERSVRHESRLVQDQPQPRFEIISICRHGGGRSPDGSKPRLEEFVHGKSTFAVRAGTGMITSIQC